MSAFELTDLLDRLNVEYSALCGLLHNGPSYDDAMLTGICHLFERLNTDLRRCRDAAMERARAAK